MQVTFKPTNYTFTFDDVYFVQLRLNPESTRVKLRKQSDQPFTACFGDIGDAKAYARDKVQNDPDVTYAWVFTRKQQVWAAGD